MLVTNQGDKRVQLKKMKAINKHNYWKCEQYMEEALRMIRKTGGEYPTE